MIVPSVQKKEAGQIVFNNYHPELGTIFPGKPMKVVAVKTKEDFIKFWEDNEKFQEYMSVFGPPPDHIQYYEVEEVQDKETRIRELVDFYFSLWGAGKSELWEEMSGGAPFNAESVLVLIRKVLEEK